TTTVTDSINDGDRRDGAGSSRARRWRQLPLSWARISSSGSLNNGDDDAIAAASPHVLPPKFFCSNVMASTDQ
ncbi:hypothetical protein S245_043198, partial [Arachis hypogaea]